MGSLDISLVAVFLLSRQVEERLKFYDTGEAPRKNISVMEKVAAEIKNEPGEKEVSAPKSDKKKKKKKKRDRKDVEEASADVEAPSSKKKKKKTASA